MENIRSAVHNDSLAELICDANEMLDADLDLMLSNNEATYDGTTNRYEDENNDQNAVVLFDPSSACDETLSCNPAPAINTAADTDDAASQSAPTTNNPDEPHVGDKIEVF